MDAHAVVKMIRYLSVARFPCPINKFLVRISRWSIIPLCNEVAIELSRFTCTLGESQSCISCPFSGIMVMSKAVAIRLKGTILGTSIGVAYLEWTKTITNIPYE